MDSISGISGLTYSTGLSGDTTSTTSTTTGTDTTSTISDKQMFNAGLVTSTLDKLNDKTSGGNADYDFQKTVLSGKAASIGLDLTA